MSIDADRSGPGGAPPDGAHPHVIVETVEVPVLDEAAHHHLGRVRRLRDGDRCTVTDGAGAWRWCVFRAREELEPDGPVHHVAKPAPELAVAFAVTKGERPDWTVQKLTELGIDRIIPFRSARSVVRWDDARAAKHLTRMRSIARAAAEQSRRCWLPVVEDVSDVEDLAGRAAVRLDRGAPPPAGAETLVAVGPEGGWTDDERAKLPDAVGLGDTVLRAETAALTAGALVVALRSGIVRSMGNTAHSPEKPGQITTPGHCRGGRDYIP